MYQLKYRVTKMNETICIIYGQRHRYNRYIAIRYRTQTFIYLTNNVYNYIQIVKKIFNKPGQETTIKTKGLPLAP